MGLAKDLAIATLLPVVARGVSVAERRARVGRRHAISAGSRVASFEAAVGAMGCLHATEPATVYLSGVARVDGLTVADVERALYGERTVIKQLAMRRTLFVFPRAVWPAALASASARVAAEERRTIARDVEKVGLADHGGSWFDAAAEAVLGALGDGRVATSSELRDELIELQGAMEHGIGTSWQGTSSFGPRVLTALSAAGAVMRAEPAGHWRAGRPRWTRTETWVDGEPERPTPDAGYDALIAGWLRTFGPGTERDLAWWLGAPLGVVRAGLGRLAAVPVDLDGVEGWVAADDVEPVEPVAPWAALLPTLDATTMGWKERDWYLGQNADELFDAVGNGGATAWWDGRIVGGWYQAPDGEVVVVPLEDIGAEADAALAVEAERLTHWLGGVRVNSMYASPLTRRHAPAR